MKIYLIGSMRNDGITGLAQQIRALNVEVFDDWMSPGPEADDFWQAYEKFRGRSYKEAINGHHAKTVFTFDHAHLSQADAVILLMPAGKSAHMELGWAIAKGKRAYVLFDKEPERYDIMYRFVYETGGDIFFNEKDLLNELKVYIGNGVSSGERPEERYTWQPLSEPLQHSGTVVRVLGASHQPYPSRYHDDACEDRPLEK